MPIYIQSLVERPKISFGEKEMFPTIYAKAAVYLESLARYHVFVDGNKRTSLAATARFLHINGCELTATDSQAEKFVLKAAQGHASLKEIFEWIRKYSTLLH